MTDISTCDDAYVSRYAYSQRANNDNDDDTPGPTGLDESAKFDPLRIFLYKDYDHDDGAQDYDSDGDINLDKTLYLGTPYEISITSRTGAAGQDEGEEALTFLAEHPNTARFICFKLAQEFVSDSPQQATSDSCEAVFLANLGQPNQMGLVLADLLSSAEFSDVATQRNKLKDNQEALISLARLLGWPADHPGLSRSHSLAQKIRDAEQRIFYKAEPTGYYETADNWLNTNITLNRFREMNDMIFHDQTRPFVTYFRDELGYGADTTSTEIMAHLFLLMLGGNYDAHDVLLGIEALHENDPENDEDETLQPFNINQGDAEERIRALVAALAALPEYQLH